MSRSNGKSGTLNELPGYEFKGISYALPPLRKEVINVLRILVLDLACQS